MLRAAADSVGRVGDVEIGGAAAPRDPGTAGRGEYRLECRGEPSRRVADRDLTRGIPLMNERLTITDENDGRGVRAPEA